MSGTAWLLVIFIVLPIVVTPFVVAFVSRRSPEVPTEHRTSWLLEHGDATTGVLVAWKNKGPFLLDGHPMVAFTIDVEGELVELTQPVARDVLAKLDEGMPVEVRRSPDRAAAAILFE
jgi:hypothetical protein